MHITNQNFTLIGLHLVRLGLKWVEYPLDDKIIVTVRPEVYS